MSTERQERVKRLALLNKRRLARDEAIPRLKGLLREAFREEELADVEKCADVIDDYWNSYKVVENDFSKFCSRKWELDDYEGIIEFFRSFSKVAEDCQVYLLLSRSEIGVLQVALSMILASPIDFASIDSGGLKIFESVSRSGLLLWRESSHYGPNTRREEWVINIWGPRWYPLSKSILEH